MFCGLVSVTLLASILFLSPSNASAIARGTRRVVERECYNRSVDSARLRNLLKTHLVPLSEGSSHARLPSLCADLALPDPSVGETKRERLSVAIDSAPEKALAETARRFLEKFKPAASVRNAIQDILWDDEAGPTIPRRYRHELANALEIDHLFQSPRHFNDLLNALWVIEDDPVARFVGTQNNSLRAVLDRHLFRNPDLSVYELFERLGAFECVDARFRRFIEGIVSADVQGSAENQRRVVDVVDQLLRPCGAKLVESGEDGGYPCFSLVSAGGGDGKPPKNIVFGSTAKPDIRFSCALNNDIEIVTNADAFLAYDRPIGAQGLLWRDLQQWWAELKGHTDPELAKATLYRRLRDELPSESPQQRFLFERYHRAFRSVVYELPALLPEVWLYWDPKTVRERGPEAALFRSRIDFLMLFPYGRRVIVEVDGKHHYADADGRANPAKYAATMASDRSLRLRGYEVFRFGTADLDESAKADEMVKAFFEGLFDLHGISYRNDEGRRP